MVVKRSVLTILLASAALVIGVLVGANALAGVRPDTPTKLSGRSVAGVKVVYEAGTVSIPFDDAFNTFIDLPGANATIKVRPGTQVFLQMQFQASSICKPTNNGFCSVRVLVNGQEAQPSDGLNASFGAPFGSYADADSILRSTGPLSPGKYRVDVQTAFSQVPGTGTGTWDLSDWTLTVTQVRL